MVMLIAAFLSLLSLVGLILTFTSGLISAGVDGIFLLLVCLVTGAIFARVAVVEAASAGYLPARFRKAHK